MKELLNELRAAPWVHDTRGGMAEYIILTIVIAVGAIAASQNLRNTLTNNFNTAANTDLSNTTLKGGGTGP